MKTEELVERARAVLNHRKLFGGDAGDVAAALVTKQGNVYVGVCIDLNCGIGFCAEHSAVAAMITGGEQEVEKIVAVWQDRILAPCGRCREMLNQLHEESIDNTTVVLEDGNTLCEHCCPIPTRIFGGMIRVDANH